MRKRILSFFALSAVAMAALLGCNNSSEAENEERICDTNGFTYNNDADYRQYCGIYCESNKVTYYTKAQYEQFCSTPSSTPTTTPKSSSSTTMYCCEYAPDHCYESIVLKNIYCPAQHSMSSSSARPPVTSPEKCSESICYIEEMHSAAGVGMGHSSGATQIAAQKCGCTL